MAKTQKYSIKYPFQSDNLDEVYVDLNEDYNDSIKSQIFHVLFTPKGQKLRDPEFGSDLVKWLFEPSDGETFQKMKETLKNDINSRVKNISFEDISVLKDENDEHSKIINVIYRVKMGNKEVENSVAIKI